MITLKQIGFHLEHTARFPGLFYVETFTGELLLRQYAAHLLDVCHLEHKA